LTAHRLEIRVVDDGNHRDLVHVQGRRRIKSVSTEFAQREI